MAEAVLEGDAFARTKNLGKLATNAVDWVAARSSAQVNDERATITMNILKEARAHVQPGAYWMGGARGQALMLAKFA